MRRLSWLPLLLVLCACQFTAPVRPVATPTTQARPQPNVQPTPAIQAAASLPPARGALPYVEAPGPSPTGTPTPTITPEPTLTPLPTTTPTIVPGSEPVVLIARPLANEFVAGTIAVGGTVTNVQRGEVRLSLQSPDGQTLGAPVLASTRVVTNTLAWEGQIQLELPPTPRPFAVLAQWAADGSASSTSETFQPINLLGRYPRVDRLIIETPAPFARGAEPQIDVRGVAPGSPDQIVARLLDASDQVVESEEADRTWVQQGLPCAFAARLPNNPQATLLQVISFGTDGQVIEDVRVRLVR